MLTAGEANQPHTTTIVASAANSEMIAAVQAAWSTNVFETQALMLRVRIVVVASM